MLLTWGRRLSSWHRWLGVGFGLLFALWFATGAVMIYVAFPSLGDGARIASAAPVSLAALRVTPSQALAAAGGTPVDRLRLVDVLGAPRYVLHLTGGRMLAVAGQGLGAMGDDALAREAPALDARRAAQVAAGFAGQPVLPQQMHGPLDHDQWTVHQRFDGARPFYRAELGDAAGTELYVSARTGEVLQRTTRFERGWNWVGAVVHWIYPTVLRKHFDAWDQTVWWLSLAAIATALLGFALGVLRTVNLRRRRGSGASPFRGWLRWHHLLGLSAGVLLLGWVFSGWLSMDHGRLFSVDQPVTDEVARWRGMSLEQAVEGVTLAQLSEGAGAREIEFIAVGGQAFVVLRGGGPVLQRQAGTGASWVVAAGLMPDLSTAATALPDALLRAAADRAWSQQGVTGLAPIAADDAYGHLRNDPLPPAARRITLGDAGRTWVHVDAASGRIVSVMDRSRRIYRWLFNGLHTFDFPLLNRAGALWKVLMLMALACGFALSLTGVVLGLRRLRRSFGGLRPG